MQTKEYRDIDAVNWSILKHHFESPAHVKYVMENGTEESEEQSLGSLLHLAILEPHKLKDLHVYERLNWTTKAGRAQKKEVQELQAAGVQTATQQAVDDVNRMAEVVFAHHDASKLVKSVSATEMMLQAELHGVPCKGLADFYSKKGQFLGDLKTTGVGARYHSFQKDAAKWHYYGQAAFYLLLCKALGIPADAFFWIVIETKPPHSVYVYQLSEVTQASCNMCIETFLQKHRVCKQTNYWPLPDGSIQPLDAPEYYFKQMEALQ
jgi:hypothetical protein